jgi:hypothetical protein
MKRLAVLFACLVLGACQMGSSLMVRDTAGVNTFTQLEGASLVLNQELNLRAGKARIFVQNGEVSGGFDSYQPHCAFEIDSVRHEGATIEAGTFTITRVQGSVQPVVSAAPVRLAAMPMVSGIAGGGGSQSYYEGFHLWLSSADQPQVRRVSCFGVYAQPYELYPPTVAEIRHALGSVAEIRQYGG